MGPADVQGGEGHTTPCPEPAEHRGIESLDGNVSRCHVMQASSFPSVITISLTQHMLQVSHPYQPRLFSTALGVLSTDVRPLSSMSKRYARGRASPSPTDGRSPTVQLPPSSSSYHHRRPTAIVVVQPPPSSSSYHCHRPAATVIVRHRVGHVDWRGYKGHVVPCTRPAWYRGIQSLDGGHQWMPCIVRIILSKWFNGTTCLYLLQVSVHGRQGCSYQPWISLTLTSPSSCRCQVPVWRLGEPSSWGQRGVLVT
jgi:hypothetical protein